MPLHGTPERTGSLSFVPTAVRGWRRLALLKQGMPGGGDVLDAWRSDPLIYPAEPPAQQPL